MIVVSFLLDPFAGSTVLPFLAPVVAKDHLTAGWVVPTARQDHFHVGSDGRESHERHSGDVELGSRQGARRVRKAHRENHDDTER